jgi:hypothetical protein
MWRPHGQGRWLGPEARVDFDPQVRSILADDAGVWRTARVVKCKPVSSVTLQIDPPPSWPSSGATRAVIVLTIQPDEGTQIAIEESGIPAGHRDEVERFWRSRLGRLARLAGRVRARRSHARQAVLVIHGIGEQQPGETLDSLVKSGVLSAEDGAQDRWVKPDRFSDSYELHRVTLKASEQRPTTDVFEFYWAHVIRDTTLAQIGAWAQRILFRWPVPQPIRPLWLLIWVALLAALAAVGASFAGVKIAERIAYSSVVIAVSATLWRILGEPFALNFIGDAARYLRPHPANIAHRQAIRQAGVQLIDKLHASGRYDRIVILGHSLGSVIAYDIVTHAWPGFHASHQNPSRATFGEITAVEKAVSDGTDPAKVQDLQHAAWRRHRINTQPWLVTDLVTVGSPLTYADFLLGKDAEAFAQFKADRVLPTCPPVTELEAATKHNRMTYDVPYADPLTSGKRTFVQFHHAAPFAVTRWTNLYFQTRRLGLVGDLIGGPVSAQLGPWIKDVPLTSPRQRFTHTWYWRRVEKEDQHRTALRDALCLDARQSLLELSREMPAFVLVGGEVRPADDP